MSDKITNLNINQKKRRSKRLLALDAARGMAVVGMFVQHFALNQYNSFVSGNTMILFILCSGISYSMMLQNMKENGIGATEIRSRVLSRAVFIDLIGYLILMLNGPFGMVLTAYAMLFVLSLTIGGCSAKKLAIISGILFWVAPPLMVIGNSLFAGTAILYDIAGGPLSALAWAPVFTAGMAIGKMDIEKVENAIKFVVMGIIIVIPSKLVAVLLLPGLRQKCENWLVKLPAYTNMGIDPYAIWPLNTQPIQWQMLFVDTPQSGTSFELLIGFGGGLILFGVLLLIEKKFSMALKPFLGAGRVALTLYVTQFVIVWVLTLIGVDVMSFDIGSVLFGDIMVAVSTLLIGCLLSKLPNGPLESAIRNFEGLFYKK